VLKYHTIKQLQLVSHERWSIKPGDQVMAAADYFGSVKPRATGIAISVSREGIVQVMWPEGALYDHDDFIIDQDFIDVGYVYAPYIPLQVTPTLLKSGSR
jgi:hypothetical protein